MGSEMCIRDSEWVKSFTGEQRMEAARRIACVLAMHGIPGYESVRKYLETYRPGDVARWRVQNHEEPPAADVDMHGRALHILSTIADPDIIPQDAVDAAEHVGGVWRRVLTDIVVTSTEGIEYTRRRFGDAFSDCYDTLMQDLLDRHNRYTMPQRSMDGCHMLIDMMGNNRETVIKAYLAAADAAKQLMEHMESPGTVPWGRPYDHWARSTFHSSDEVARYINDWIDAYYEAVPPNDQYGQ